jgi:hypothetical protein
METTMAAIETALAVTLLPHFIAVPPLYHDVNFPITRLTSLPTIAGASRGDRRLRWQEKEMTADVDEFETLDNGGRPNDLNGTWTDAEKNLNLRRKGSRDQSWSPSRAVMSMACRNTSTITNSAARMNSTLYGVFFSMYKTSLVHILILSSPLCSGSIYRTFGYTAPPRRPQSHGNTVKAIIG